MAKKLVRKAVQPKEEGSKDLKKVGERLKHYRRKAGYTSSEYFAYENGISRPQ